MFGLAEIEGDPTVQCMLERRRLIKGSKKTYVKAVQFVCEYFKTRLEKLYPRFN